MQHLQFSPLGLGRLFAVGLQQQLDSDAFSASAFRQHDGFAFSRAAVFRSAHAAMQIADECSVKAKDMNTLNMHAIIADISAGEKPKYRLEFPA